MSWQTQLFSSLQKEFLHKPVWRQFYSSYADSGRKRLHLAIFVEPYLRFILEGKKTVESRFSVNLCAPHGRVEKGDIVLLKRSGGSIVGVCQILNVWFYELDPNSWRDIRREFTQSLCAQAPDFWKARQHASYATLMRVGRVTRIGPIDCSKKDRRGWVVIGETDTLFSAGVGKR